MTAPYMPFPVRPDLSDADYWEQLRDRGLSSDEATHHVQLRGLANSGPDVSREEMANARDMGPTFTALQSAGETIGSVPKMVGQMLTPVATHIVQSLHTSPEGQAEVGRAGQDIYNLFGKLDPANALSDEERQTVATSQERNPLATDIGTFGAMFGVPAAVGASKLVGSRMEKSALERRLLNAKVEAAEARAAALREPSVAAEVGKRLTAPPEPTPNFPPTLPEPFAIQRELSENQPQAEPVHPDAAKAMDDFDAGKIGGQDLRDAIDASLGKTPGTTQLPVRGEVAATMPTPSRVAPTVPGGGTATPGYGGNPQGIDVTGPRPTPPAPTAPTVTEILEGNKGPLAGIGKGSTLPYYPRGGAAEQAVPPKPTPELQPASFKDVSTFMGSPMYKQAGVLAQYILKSPEMLERFPAFKGMDAGQATAELQRQLLENVRRGGPMPSLINLGDFVEKLAQPTP